MSRQTVRRQIAAWLTGVDGIGRVYRSFPTQINPGDFFGGDAGVSFGCVAIVHLASDIEHRVSMGGPNSGQKRVDYLVEIHLYFQAVAAGHDAEDDRAVDAGDAFDAIIDNLKFRIRQDRTAGNPLAVWQWGEASLGSMSGQMIDKGDGALEQWAMVTTEATEWLIT